MHHERPDIVFSEEVEQGPQVLLEGLTFGRCQACLSSGLKT
jgi:hypothetical protein